MNDLLEKLAGSLNRKESSEHLQLLAKRAASMYRGSEADSLTNAVHTVVGDEDLNKDQVRRVAEMANQATWKSIFVESGDTETNFTPASADDVLGSLSESPSSVHSPSIDYLSDPKGETTPEDVRIEDVFKTDSDESYEKINPHVEDEVKLDKVASALDLARYGADKLLPEVHKVGAEFYNLVKQACIRDNNGILQISKAVGQVVESEKFAHAVMESTVNSLKAEGIKFDIKNELRKSAEAVVINTEHPLMVAAAKFEKVSQAYTRATTEEKKLSVEFDAQSRALKASLRGL